MFALGHHYTYHSVGRGLTGCWFRMGSAAPLQLLPVRHYLHLSNTLFFFPALLFKFFFPWDPQLSCLLETTYSDPFFQPIVWNSFFCSFLDIFSPKAPHARRTTHCWSCIFSTETPLAFHADKREGVWPVLIPELSLWCSLCPSPQKVEDLNI